jgi:succinate dehydrogenase / fumarate reductase, flavoprotein subunit
MARTVHEPGAEVLIAQCFMNKRSVLVIGAGAAGLRAAIELKRRGVDCLVVGKRRHGDAHTRWAAGGINAALASLDPEDRWEIHAADTLREGGFLCQPRAVELLAREAPDRIRELSAWGCPFHRTGDGRIAQRYFGAQSFRRTCFVGDVTGEAILETLVDRASREGVEHRENVFITRILVEGGAVTGAEGRDLETGEWLRIAAEVVVLAAGGCTSLYRRGSSRADENTGDAMALALDAGAELRDMEMIQFHPTGMVEPPDMRGRLVTEAVRGEGGHLLNAQGERIMERYAPDAMELAARDVVARAIYQEIRAGRGTPEGAVLLDISHVPAPRIRERLPEIHRQFAGHGVDITREPVEVAPTAHYPMGGVVVDPDTGATGVVGLLAVGEAAAGVHGANRLGGNSLAETVVFGRRAGAFAAAWVGAPSRARWPAPADPNTASGAHSLPPPDPHSPLPPPPPGATASRPARTAPSDPAAVMERLREVMWDRAGIVRDGDGLARGLAELHELEQAAAGGEPEPLDHWAAAVNLRFALLTAQSILLNALARQESRGAHYREDHPETDDLWRRSIVCSRSHDDGGLRLRTEPVPPIPPAIQRALDEGHALDYHHLE